MDIQHVPLVPIKLTMKNFDKINETLGACPIIIGGFSSCGSEKVPQLEEGGGEEEWEEPGRGEGGAKACQNFNQIQFNELRAMDASAWGIRNRPSCSCLNYRFIRGGGGEWAWPRPRGGCGGLSRSCGSPWWSSSFAYCRLGSIKLI